MPIRTLPYTPSLADLLEGFMQAELSKVRVGMPGVIESYNATEQSCNVRPVFIDTDGTELPIITRVPVLFPQGGGFALTWPLQKDDHVWLLFAERDIDSWLATGNRGTPPSGRKFDFSDAVAIAGISPYSDNLASATSDTLVLGEDSATGMKLKIKDGKVRLGNSTTDIVTALSALIGVLKTGVTTGGFVFNPATVTALDLIKTSIDGIKL